MRSREVQVPPKVVHVLAVEVAEGQVQDYHEGNEELGDGAGEEDEDGVGEERGDELVYPLGADGELQEERA